MKKPGDKLVGGENYNNLTDLTTAQKQELENGSWGNYEKGDGWTSTFVFTGKVIRQFIQSMYQKVEQLVNNVINLNLSGTTLTITQNDGNSVNTYKVKTINEETGLNFYLAGFDNQSNNPTFSNADKITTLVDGTFEKQLQKSNETKVLFYLKTDTSHILANAKTSNNETWLVGANEIIKNVTPNGVDYKLYQMQFDSAPSTQLKVTFYFN